MKRLATSWFLCLVAFNASAQFVRLPASEFEKNPTRVAALQRAVAQMKQNDSAAQTSATFRQSWFYWANTHGYFGSGPNASGTAQAFKASAPSQDACGSLADPVLKATCISYYSHVRDFSIPNDGITINVWGTCQHTTDFTNGPGDANMQFLPWHRIMLKYYERALRKNSGDPNFTLPYWDYSDELGPRSGIALPAMMRGSASTNTLTDTSRTPGLNDNTSSINPNNASAVAAFKYNDFQSFSWQLEQQPHGTMHCGTGFGCRAPDMGIIPPAGLDPVFYMHHANIDRLWQCWMVNLANGKTIDLAWAKANLGQPQSWFDQTWSFVDENGAAVSMKVSDLFEPGGIDYIYQQTTNCVPPNVAATAAVAAPAPRIRRAASSRGVVSLRGKSVNVPLQPGGLDETQKRVPESVRVASGRSVLILENVRIEGGHPGMTYDIYIARASEPSKRAYIATFSWFGKFGPHHGGGHAEHGARPRGFGLLFYDVTDELARLGDPPESDTVVTFEPASEVAGRSPKISAGAGTVTVGAIRLQTKE